MTRDGQWVAISASATTVAERVMRLVGHPELIEEPWFASAGQRVQHADELDQVVGDWIAKRDRDEVIRAFDEAGAAIAPIYDVAQLMMDPQIQALQSVVTVQDEDLGPLKMQNVMFRTSETPGAIKLAGRRLGQDNEVVYCDRLGLSKERLAQLQSAEVV